MSGGVLVAGVGNVFLGDDAFGVEVVRALRDRALPLDVQVVDFGIRALDLAFALERVEAAVIVDACTRGGPPGTLYVIEPEAAKGADAGLSPHAITPQEILARLAPVSRPRSIYLIGCEPGSIDDDGAEGLSPEVREAVGRAADMVEALVGKILDGGRPGA